MNRGGGRIRAPILSARSSKDAKFYAGHFGNNVIFTDFAPEQRYEPFSEPGSSADFVKNPKSGHGLYGRWIGRIPAQNLISGVQVMQNFMPDKTVTIVFSSKKSCFGDMRLFLMTGRGGRCQVG